MARSPDCETLLPRFAASHICLTFIGAKTPINS